jgi:hypothetical protein
VTRSWVIPVTSGLRILLSWLNALCFATAQPCGWSSLMSPLLHYHLRAPVAGAASFSKSLSPSAFSGCRIRAHPELNVVDGATPSARHIAPRHRGHIPHSSKTATTGDDDRLGREKSRNNRKPQPSRALPLCIHTVTILFPRTAFAFVSVQELLAPSSVVMWSWEEVEARKRFPRGTGSHTDVKCLARPLAPQPALLVLDSNTSIRKKKR